MVEAVTVVRSLHILFAVAWAGAAFHFARITNPALRSSRHEFLAHSRHGPYMGVTALGTVAFGFATYFMIGPDAYSGAQNAILGIGMLAAMLGLLMGFGGHLPNSIRIKAALAAADEARLRALGHREDVFDRVSMASVGIALMAMIVFRWF